MPRKREVERRATPPDPKYGDTTLQVFINYIMRSGKKSVAERIVYDAMEIVAEKTKEDPLKFFHQALDNVKPVTEVRSARVGGSTYQVPVEVRSGRRNALAMRWLIGFATSRAGGGMADKLAGELIDAANNRGATVKKKEDTHRMAEANRAFSHYRW